MQEDRKAWYYATAIMLAISIVVLILRVGSFIIFTLEFEVPLVYVPTIVLIAISTYLTARGRRSLG